MSKKKSNSRVINNIDNLNLEIDYDKLAQAIVKANAVNENSTEKESKPKEKVTLKNFLKTVRDIIINKKQSNGEMTSSLFSIVICSFFNTIAVLGLLLFVLFIIASIITIKNFEWTTISTISTNIFGIVLAIIFLAVIAMLSLFFRASANEMAVEKDRNYIVSVFSAVICFVALIVSLVALIKGVV